MADTENHAVRRVYLHDKYVDTMAGNGEQGPFGNQGGSLGEVGLNSPWDLTVHRGTVSAAMAGYHQLWALDELTLRAVPHAGSGREDIHDGPMRSAALAQPSGITNDRKRLYFVDSETSSIRMADMSLSGRVTTIVGRGLFEFGDVDGIGTEVRLQHPLGLCLHDGVLYVTDAYNHKIKKIYPENRASFSFLGSGEAGFDDGVGSSATFFEPGGISAAHGKLYIADTNNHAIRVAGIGSGEVRTLEITGL